MTPQEIKRAAQGINQRYDVRMGANLSYSAKEELRTLAQMCGMREYRNANDADLVSVFLVALKDGVSAVRVANRVDMRLDANLLGPPIIPSAPPLPMPGGPLPAPQAPASVDMGAIRAMIATEVREGALEPLQAALVRTDDALRGDFAHMLVGVRTDTLDDVRAEIATSAHAAAIEAVRSMTPTRLDVSVNAAPAVPLGLVHKDTPKIIGMLAAGVNVYLHGPAGSGKTTVAQQAAKAFGLQFYFAAKVESEYQLLGFKDAKGETVRTQFREAYEHGGQFLFDEMDASSPSAVVALNAALANGVCAFPDGIIARHPDFKVIGAGNTKLTGANRQYAGRNQLDAASIDRFAFLYFGYDDELENALAPDKSWAAYVQRVRAVIEERGLTHLVTPRATYDGCKLLAAGFDRDTVASMVVYKGLDVDTVAQIEHAL
jgi:hypothetical protein